VIGICMGYGAMRIFESREAFRRSDRVMINEICIFRTLKLGPSLLNLLDPPTPFRLGPLLFKVAPVPEMSPLVKTMLRRQLNQLDLRLIQH
jgi:hypothetical protein